MFLLLISGFLCLVLGAEIRQYHLINDQKNWTEAQTFCRTSYIDLATISTAEDMSGLFRNISALTSSKVYIGLRRSSMFSWHWSLADGSRESWDFSNWRARQASALSQDMCALMEPNGEWSENNCSKLRPFVCINASGSYVLVKVSMSWRDAQEYCRTFYTDLASARSSSENQAVNLASQSQQVWLGLFKDSWVWSDLSNSSYRFWDTNLPNSVPGQDCVVAVMNQGGRWNNVICATLNSFICQGLNVQTFLPQVTSTELPTTQNQPTPDQNITPQVATAAGTSPTSSDVTPETMDGSTSEQATATGPTAQTTTRQTHASTTLTAILEGPAASSHSGSITARPTSPTEESRSTEFADDSTLAVPIPVQPQSTPTQSTSIRSSNYVDTTDTTTAEIPQEFAIQGTTTVGNLATVLQQHTDVQTVTEPADSTPTANTPDGANSANPDHLILVNENATWSEAVKYCREHHMDLVSILSAQEQNSVEKKASLASSDHVWLGLSYSCSFNFWFWIRNREAGCYQNWAPGHGTGGLNDCGMAGAIESSSEHRWVRRPQSDKLNFICFACVQCQTCSTAG